MSARRRDSRWIADMLAVSDVPVQKIAEGVRGVPSSKRRDSRKGRPGPAPEKGERYPCGKLKPRSEISPALWQRIKTNAIRFGEDSRLASELSRLSMLGHLTAAQTAAGLRMAEIYGRFERTRGLRRSAKSAAYDRGHGDPDLAEERMTPKERERLVEQQALVRQEFEDLQANLAKMEEGTPNERAVRGARGALEALCVEDRPIDPFTLADIPTMLDRLAKAFGDAWRRRKPGPGRPERKISPPTGTVPRRSPAEQSELPAKTAFRAMLGKLRPDLDADGIERAWSIHNGLEAAFTDRERVRREKTETRKSPIVAWRAPAESAVDPDEIEH